MKKIFFLLLFLSFYQNSNAQTTKDSLEKSDTPKFIKAFTGSKWLVAPFLIYLPETNWILGAGIKRFFNAGGEGDSTTRVSNTAIFAQYSLNHQIIFEHNYQIFTKHEKYYLMGFWGFTRFPVYYYGVGKNPQEATKELINYDLFRFENITYRRPIAPIH